MKRRNFSTTTSAIAFILSLGGPAMGQTADALNGSVDLSEARLLSNGEAITTRARPHANPLEAPDVSGAFAEADDGLDVPGVMTDDGPADEADISARAFGSFGIPYTSTRVQEGNRSVASLDANRLSTTHPYRTIGKLTFLNGGRASFCSATVIRRGIIVTAAHCIQAFGSGNTIFSNFQFRPGHYGAAGASASQFSPYGTWTPFRLTRPLSWANGTDIGCGAARQNDLAVMVMRRQNGQFIGDRVGYLGYAWNNYSFVSSARTGNLSTAAVSTLGYPGLLDAGRIMQRTDGPTYTTTVCNAPQLWQGSNLTGGSSGGPWIVNFSGRNAALSGGAVAGSAPFLAVIGVTSWGSANPNTPKDNYSSQFGQNSLYPNANYGGLGAGNIGSVLNSLCNSAAPEGGTLASQGYCS